MAVDLHLHSSVSDGTNSPGEVVRLAADAGLSALALTDHDTLAGIPEAAATADRLGIRLVAGTELSVNWPTGTMHMLVYFLSPGPGPLQDRLDGLVSARTTRNHQILERLADLGMVIEHDAVVAEAGGGVVGRPHIAALMVERGYVDTIAAAFDRWLGSGRPAYVPRRRLDAVEAIDLARRSGGLPVIAHPHTLGAGAADYGEAFATLAAAGLAGIEAHYSEYAPELRTHLARLASSLGLIATGGSDYHGRYKPGLAVGVGLGDLCVTDDVLDALDAAHRRGDA